MKIIKFIITLFFLISSYWVSYLIFSRNFLREGINYSADNWNENTFMILLTSTALSFVAIFFLGILSIFTNFVFIKMIYAEEIKQAAVFYVKNRKSDTKELREYRKSVHNIELHKMTVTQKIKHFLSKIRGKA